MDTSPQKTQFFPPIEPYNSGMLKVSDLHEIYFEECGNPQGKPAVFLHGGPGGGLTPTYRQFFDPDKYRIVLFDQRGCGKSKPWASIEQNTTWDLVSDIETIRKQLKIEKWLVFGGSWGSTLALTYAQTHPDRVTELVLRGIFTLRKSELQWFYQAGANEIYPDAWQAYEQAIPKEERHDYLKAYHKRLTSDDEDTRYAAAKAWSQWEAGTSRLFPDPKTTQNFGEKNFAPAFARIECHYFINAGFFDSDDQIIKNVDRIRHIPCVIVQGRYDVVCPMRTAWELSKAWPEAKLVIVQDAGHSAFEPGIASALIDSTNSFSGN